MRTFKEIQMTLRDADIIDSVNSLGSEHRARLFEFIGHQDIDQDDVDALLAASATKRPDGEKSN